MSRIKSVDKRSLIYRNRHFTSTDNKITLSRHRCYVAVCIMKLFPCMTSYVGPCESHGSICGQPQMALARNQTWETPSVFLQLCLTSCIKVDTALQSGRSKGIKNRIIDYPRERVNQKCARFCGPLGDELVTPFDIFS